MVFDHDEFFVKSRPQMVILGFGLRGKKQKVVAFHALRLRIFGLNGHSPGYFV